MEELLNKKAPQFSLFDQNGNKVSLSDFSGSWILLYFYPKDDTPGCTKEACAIRDSYSEYKNNGIVVLGVSTDSVKSHKKFQEKYELPFTLLADENKEVVEKYKVYGEKKFMGKTFLGTKRVSFLIDPSQVVKKVYPKVKPAEHASQVLDDIKLLKSQ